MAINTGGPAFPCKIPEGYDADENPISSTYSGMSLRDYFAGQALMGILASVKASDVVKDLTGPDGPAVCARFAYYAADAMIQQRRLELADGAAPPPAVTR